MTKSIRRFAFGLALVVAGVALAPAAPAAGTHYVDKKHGFRMRLLPGWTQTPIQPGEETEVAKFKDDRKGDFATLSIYRFAAAAAEATPGDDGAAGDGGEDPNGARNPFEIPGDAHGYLEALLSRQYRGRGMEYAGLPESRELKAGPVKGEYFLVEIENKKYRTMSAGVAAGILSDGKEEYLILYAAPLNQFDRKDQRAFLYSMSTFRFPGDETPEDAEEEDVSKRGRATADEEDLLDPEKREKIKAELIGTWRFIDTPHYIVIYNCDNGLARFIADRIEWMRVNAFEKVFPPVEPIREAMVVRVCKEMDEYHHYGGPPGSAGYWASFRDELVFPDLSSGKKPDDTTIGVLHHEGFHQYINYALLKHDPPIWFNEGFAEYFFCVQPRGDRMAFEKRHPMRYSTVKSSLGTGDLIPLRDFVKLSHMQYMQRAQLCYSQGWAFATWLKNVTRNERWQRIPEIFFREMQTGWLERKGDGDDLPPGFGRGDDGVEQRAFDKAFEGVDLDELNEAFLGDVKRRM